MKEHRLQINCFQSFQASINGRPITDFRMVREQALLTYLAVERDTAARRSTLIGLLWPDKSEQKARRNLTQIVVSLRNTLGDRENQRPFLQTTAQAIELNPDSDLWVDVIAFEASLAAVRGHAHDQIDDCDFCLTQLQQAIDLYQGPFLADLTVPKSDLFENWVLTKREYFQQQVLDAVTQVAMSHEHQGDFDQAQTYIRHGLDFVPWQESLHRQLMRVLALRGQRGLALAQYEICQRELQEALMVKPGLETVSLYEQIRDGVLTTGTEKNKQTEKAFEAVQVSSQVDQPPPFQAMVPPPHFVGREEAIEQLRAGLQQPNAKLQAIVGMGGAGKTTLAAQMANILRDDFADGVLWANAATSQALDILAAWARAYNYNFSGLPDLASRAAAVRGMLVEKRVLIIIDNVVNAGDVKSLLPGGDTVATLITTRDLDVAHALNAQVIKVDELSDGQGQQLLIRLLGEERVMAEIKVAQEICQLLQNLPLAIEIVAQRLKSRPRQRLLQLAVRLHDERYRLGLEISDQAIRTSFEVSWAVLDEQLQRLFAVLAVFETRAFPVEAVAAITQVPVYEAEDSLYDLTTLSLLNEAENQKFRLHALLADFAREKLDHATSIQERFVDYYYHFVKENQSAYEILLIEWENITAAIGTSYEQKQTPRLLSFADMLTETWFNHGYYNDAHQVYTWVRDCLTDHESDHTVLALNLSRLGKTCIELGSYDEAKQYLVQSLKLYTMQQDKAEIATIKQNLARIALEQGKIEAAKTPLVECLNLQSQLGNMKGVADTLYWQAYLHYSNGTPDDADTVAQEALALQKSLGDLEGQIPTLRMLAHIAAQSGALDRAQAFAEQALDLSKQLQNEDELASTYYTLTSICRRQKTFQVALTYAEKGLILLKRMGLRRTEGQLLYQLSGIYREMGDLEQAFHINRQSIIVFNDLQLQLSHAYALRFQGDLYQDLGQYEQAQATWREVQLIGEALNHSDLLASLQNRFALHS